MKCITQQAARVRRPFVCATALLLSGLALSACGNTWHTQSAPPPALQPLTHQNPLSAPLLRGQYRPEEQPTQRRAPLQSPSPDVVAPNRPAPKQAENKLPTRRPAPRPIITPYPHYSTGQPLEIKLFRSYGSEQRMYISGRLMKPEDADDAKLEDSDWNNFWRNVKALSVKEVGQVKLRLTLNRRSVILSSDDEGMLQISSRQFGELPPGRYPVRAEIVPGQGFSAPLVEGPLWVHSAKTPQLGVLSDIDDTLLQTEVSNKLQALKNFFLENQYSATPIAGMATLFQTLKQQLALRNGSQKVPFFYLSGSPLNFATRVYGFLDLQGFPQGGVTLKKWGFGEDEDNPIKQQDYKARNLKQIFELYPSTQFLLFGDSSEHDTEIYTQMASEYPNQVKAIFIHNVNGQDPQDARFAQVHLIDNAAAAASHLQKLGYLSAQDIQEVNQAF